MYFKGQVTDKFLYSAFINHKRGSQVPYRFWFGSARCLNGDEFNTEVIDALSSLQGRLDQNGKFQAKFIKAMGKRGYHLIGIGNGEIKESLDAMDGKADIWMQEEIRLPQSVSATSKLRDDEINAPSMNMGVFGRPWTMQFDKGQALQASNTYEYYSGYFDRIFQLYKDTIAPIFKPKSKKTSTGG